MSVFLSVRRKRFNMPINTTLRVLNCCQCWPGFVDTMAQNRGWFSRDMVSFSGSVLLALQWKETHLSVKSSKAEIHKAIAIHLVSEFSFLVRGLLVKFKVDVPEIKFNWNDNAICKCKCKCKCFTGKNLLNNVFSDPKISLLFFKS